MKYFVVDAFTEEPFRGNPAGVCLLEKQAPDALLQNIAAENNLPETAFLLKDAGGGADYRLRWFTPVKEMDLCGHATLASAFVLLNILKAVSGQVSFATQSGKLIVTRNDGLLTMDFPSRPPRQIALDPKAEKALGSHILEAWQGERDMLLLLASESEVKELKPNIPLLQSVKDCPFIITAQSSHPEYDFVSRFFDPNDGIVEDPVTGSSHTTLVPFWSARLHKDKFHARQLSARGGALYCENHGERVSIAGKATLYMQGEIAAY
jgi:PhzF family phenazine biosynthesis protein